jgi:hypothetical protein
LATILAMSLTLLFACSNKPADTGEGAETTPPPAENTAEETGGQGEASFGESVGGAGDVGDSLSFGTWRGEPIAWRVLAVEDGRALLISEDILAIRQYDDLDVTSTDLLDWDAAATTWAESDIRAWLNDEFLNSAFTEEEQQAIHLSQLSTPDNPESGTSGGADTEDRVFFLSLDEVDRYFSDDEDRVANITMTEEDIQYSLRIEEDYWGYGPEDMPEIESDLRTDFLGRSEAYAWRLRSPGDYGGSSAGIYSSGRIHVSGAFVNHSSGVRPALWLNP